MKKGINFFLVLLNIFPLAISSKDEGSFKIKIEVKNTTKVNNTEISLKNKFIIKSKLTQEELENYFKAKQVHVIKVKDKETGEKVKLEFAKSIKIKEIIPNKKENIQKNEQQVFLQQKKIEEKENKSIFSFLIYLAMIFGLFMILYFVVLKNFNPINKLSNGKIEFSDGFNYTLHDS